MAAIALARIFVRSPTRIRAFFTATVDSAVGTVFSLSSTDGSAVPTPVEFLILSGNQIEVILDSALTGGGNYSLSLNPTRVSNGSDTAPPVTFDFTAPSQPQAPSGSLSITQLSAAFFGEDIQWSGTDWVEGPDGDIAVASGPENARTAVIRRELSEGVLWDASYGLKPSEFVDAPAGELPSLMARMETQALADDRVKKATATLLGADASDPEQQLVNLNLTLADGTSTSATVPVTAG